MNRILSLSLGLCLCLGAAAHACDDASVGINLAGAEFGKIPGREGVDYRFPTASQVAYFSAAGFRSIRLPVRWERLQPALMMSLDRKYLDGMLSVFDSAAANGMDVLIDLHNYARYRNELVGSAAVPREALFDVWKRIASVLGSHPALHGYGLMNEPFRTQGLWHEVAQAGIDGIRSVDQRHKIYVAGEGFSNTRTWGTLNPVPFVRDPSNLEVYEGHIYLDYGGSGKYVSPDPVRDPGEVATERMEPFIQWLAQHGKKGAIGEFGVPSDDDRWFGGVERLLESSRQHCLRTYIWAGGNWSPGYKLSLQPLNGSERPLTRYLARLLGGKAGHSSN